MSISGITFEKKVEDIQFKDFGDKPECIAALKLTTNKKNTEVIQEALILRQDLTSFFDILKLFDETSGWIVFVADLLPEGAERTIHDIVTVTWVSECCPLRKKLIMGTTTEYVKSKFKGKHFIQVNGNSEAKAKELVKTIMEKAVTAAHADKPYTICKTTKQEIDDAAE